MKKTAILLVICALFASTATPLLAQKPVCYYHAKGPKRVVGSTYSAPVARSEGPVTKKRAVAPRSDYADFANVTAFNTEKGNVIEWEMASEKGNLGFYVYRQGKTGREKISDSITPGSSSIGSGEVVYGQKYQAVDYDGQPGDSYFVEALGPFGERITTDEIALERGERSASDFPILAAGKDAGTFQSIEPAAEKAGSKIQTEAADLSMHRWVVNNPGAKIAVRTEGLYRVRLSELQAASNVFNSGNTANWRLFREGIEQSAIVASDANGPYIEFYGRPIDTRESDTRIYYLIVDPNTVGARIPRQKVTDTANVSTSYTAVYERKERTTYIGNIFNGDNENWWGRSVGSPTTMTLTLTGVDTTAASAVVDVHLQGWSFTGIPPSVQVTLNGTPLGVATASNSQVPFSKQFTIPGNLLQEGSNSLMMSSTVGNNTELFDRVYVTYSRKYIAASNRLFFEYPQKSKAAITGFTSPSVRLFNVADPDRPTILGGVTVTQAPDLTYTANIPGLAVRRGRNAYAVAEGGTLSSPSVTTNRPSNYSSTIRQADMIIIHHAASDFETAANTWANYRRTHDNASVTVVDVADIFDEFNYGSSSAAAIKAFLAYVDANWTTQVAGKRYVLLLGDANLDPRNYKNLDPGYYDQVPTMVVTTPYAEVASDEALGDLGPNPDGLAEMAVGRVPFRTVAGINTAYNKTVSFEASPTLRDINRGVFFTYDAPIGYNFAAMSQDQATYLPPEVPKTYLARDSHPDISVVHANMMSQLNSGPYLVNFTGHGSQGFWGSSGFLDMGAVNNELANGANQSIYTMMTCLTGYFNDHSSDCIAELFLRRSTAGGPASWASSGLTTAENQMIMSRRFLSKIGEGSIPRMGDLVRDAKSVIQPGTDVRYTWILFGDPMLSVR